MTIAENLEKIKKTLPEHVSLVAISKTKSIAQIMEAYDAGQRIFGENKVQELQVKHPEMPKDIQWHMVGHLQRNKVKDLAPFISLIHAVDSIRLLRRIDREAKNNDRVIDCLLQMKIAEEESKHGLSEEEIKAILTSEDFQQMKNIRIVGLMGMATFTDDREQVTREFRRLKTCFDALQLEHNFTVLSMGMSGDYDLAIEEGSTMIRVGSSIFGEREY